MIKVEKLSSSNWKYFLELHKVSEVKSTNDKSFLEYYNKQNFLTKRLVKKFIRLLKYKNNYIGFFWYEPPLDVYINIWQMFILEEYIEFLNDDILNNFNNSILAYNYKKHSNLELALSKLGFKEINKINMMKLMLTNYDKTEETSYILKDIINNSNLIKIYNKLTDSKEKNISIDFKPFKEGKDEELRCKIQNSIFASKDREMLIPDDIYNDTMQEYYLKDFSLFVLVNNLAVGFVQIIFLEEMYMLVNFGIIPEFRGYGLSKLLLNKILLLCKKSNLKNINLKVRKDNCLAIDLYSWAGFKNEYEIILYERSK